MWAYLVPNPFNTDPRSSSFFNKTTKPFDPDNKRLKVNKLPLMPFWMTGIQNLMDPFLIGWIILIVFVIFLLLTFVFFGLMGFVACSVIITPLLSAYLKQKSSGAILGPKWIYRSNVQDKVVIVTGGSSGIGASIVSMLIEWKAKTIVIGCRREIDTQEMKRTASIFASNTEVIWESLDLADRKSVSSFVNKIKQKYNKIDLLFNNSGIVNNSLLKTKEGRDEMMEVNHLAQFGLTKLLMNELKAAGTETDPSRVIFTNSLAYLFPCGAWISQKERISSVSLVKHLTNPSSTDTYYNMYEYGLSKFCSLLAMRGLQNKIKSEGCKNVKLYAFHPGCVFTPILKQRTGFFGSIITFLYKTLMKEAADGAATAMFLATLPSKDLSDGGFYMDCKEVPNPPECYDSDLMSSVLADGEDCYHKLKEIKN